MDKNTDSIDIGFFGISIKKEELVIVGSKPNVGKSALAYSILRNIGITNHIPTAVITTGTFFGDQLKQRLLSYESGINYRKIQNEALSDNDKEKLKNAVQKLNASPVYTEDFPNGSLEEIKQAVNNLVNKNNVEIVLIDSYDFLNEVVNNKLSMSKILLEYKHFAQLYNITVIILMDLPADCNPRSLDIFKKDVTVTRIADTFIFLDREIENNFEKNPTTTANLIYCKNNSFTEYEIKLETGMCKIRF